MFAATRAVVSQHMFVWMPHTATRSIPSSRSHPARSGSPWNAEFTFFVTSRSGSPVSISSRSLPGCPGVNGEPALDAVVPHEHDRLSLRAPRLDQRRDVVLGGGVVPLAPHGIGETLLNVHDEQRDAVHGSRSA